MGARLRLRAQGGLAPADERLQGLRVGTVVETDLAASRRGILDDHVSDPEELLPGGLLHGNADEAAQADFNEGNPLETPYIQRAVPEDVAFYDQKPPEQEFVHHYGAGKDAV